MDTSVDLVGEPPEIISTNVAEMLWNIKHRVKCILICSTLQDARLLLPNYDLSITAAFTCFCIYVNSDAKLRSYVDGSTLSSFRFSKRCVQDVVQSLARDEVPDDLKHALHLFDPTLEAYVCVPLSLGTVCPDLLLGRKRFRWFNYCGGSRNNYWIEDKLKVCKLFEAFNSKLVGAYQIIQTPVNIADCEQIFRNAEDKFLSRDGVVITTGSEVHEGGVGAANVYTRSAEALHKASSRYQDGTPLRVVPYMSGVSMELTCIVCQSQTYVLRPFPTIFMVDETEELGSFIILGIDYRWNAQKDVRAELEMHATGLCTLLRQNGFVGVCNINGLFNAAWEGCRFFPTEINARPPRHFDHWRKLFVLDSLLKNSTMSAEEEHTLCLAILAEDECAYGAKYIKYTLKSQTYMFAYPLQETFFLHTSSTDELEFCSSDDNYHIVVRQIWVSLEFMTTDSASPNLVTLLLPRALEMVANKLGFNRKYKFYCATQDFKSMTAPRQTIIRP
mmetsp:Transcript_3983/g.13956  ORF Transcript_3983/g.13956 Transcript_3983/m.13956 type:complete len:503 (+) Transcript_3983:406-1914(+)